MTLGKYAKREGMLHPSVIRRIDKVPPKATPRVRNAKARKPYGYSYEHRGYLTQSFSGRPFRAWFRTEKARDQAMAAAERDSISWAATLNTMRKDRGAEQDVEPVTRNYIKICRYDSDIGE